MKINKIISAFVALSAIFAGCTQTEYDPIALDLGQKWPTTITIAQLKTVFLGAVPIAPSNNLFGAVAIGSSPNLVFNGIVTSSDNEGNVYKYIVVQEEGVGGQAMKISIDASSIAATYPLGQRVSVRCNNLAIGIYAQGPQMGEYFYNEAKTRVEPGRIPKLLSDINISAYGLPEPDSIKADTMTIAQIKASGTTLVNKLVCIKDAYFTGKGAEKGMPINIPLEADLIFAPSTNGVGYPQSREIQDGTGSVFISTSEYSKFATKAIPESTNRGNITAIIGWYNDKDATPISSKTYHQLTIRSLSDLGKGFEAYHAKINK